MFDCYVSTEYLERTVNKWELFSLEIGVEGKVASTSTTTWSIDFEHVPQNAVKNIMQCGFQWRNVEGLAKKSPLGGKKSPLRGAPRLRVYLEQFVKKWPKNLNK
jgi:hypothetical protein